MKRIKSIFSFALAVLLFVFSVSVPAGASAFPDVYSTTTYLDAINYVSDNGIMVGEEGGYFNPNNSLTRAMCVMVLYKLAGKPGAYSGQSFSDVPTTAWYYDAVQWAVSEGITSGTGNGKFEPNKTVIRQDAMRFFYLYATKVANVGISRSANISGYSDYSSVSSYAQSAVAWAMGNDMLQTVSGKIDPKSTITRSKLAYAVTRFGTNVERLRWEDILSFANEGVDDANFNFSQTHYISVNHQNKYKNKLKAKYGSGASYESALKEWNDFRNSKPGGRCFGMSAVCALDKYGKIAFNENINITPKASNMASVISSKGFKGTDVESMITYYQLSQKLPFLDIEKVGKSSISTVMNELINAPGISCLGFSANDQDNFDWKYNHAVLVTSCTYSGGNYILRIYDPDKAAIVTETISYRSNAYFLSNWDKLLCAYAITNFSSMDFFDIDGYQNSKSFANSSNSLSEPMEAALEAESERDTGVVWDIDPEEFSTVYFYLEDGVTITNDRGETLTWKDGDFSGDMEVYYWNFIAGTSPALAYVDVPVSETFQIEVPGGREGKISIVDKHRFQYAENFTGSATLGSDGSIKIDSAIPNSEIEAGFYSYATGDELCKVSGKASQSVALNLKQSALKVDGLLGEYTVTKTDKNKNESVSVYKPEVETMESTTSNILTNGTVQEEVDK